MSELSKFKVHRPHSMVGVPNTVLDDERLNGDEVLACIAVCKLTARDEDPTLNAIAAIARLSVEQTQQAIKRLVDLGILQKPGGTNHDN